MSQQVLSFDRAPIVFKRATEPDELEQIHRLNYRTFVDEIPQHPPNGDGVLVDRYDHENTYIVALRGDRVVGMVAVREKRPFSLDGKLANLDSYLPAHRGVCEMRLLAVEPEHRTGVVFGGLISAVVEYATSAGFDLAVISGTVRQLKLYRHMGFVPFGPIVGTADAPYQPMYLTRQSYDRSAAPALTARSPRVGPLFPATPAARDVAHGDSFLPGPVRVHPSVWSAFTRTPVSHRHPEFASDLRATSAALTRLAGAKHVQLLVGSGTLANDAVAAQLSLLGARGLVLTNGEFGDRLVDHATRARLSCDVLRADWGAAFDMDAVERAVRALPRGGWCWFVHCETSSGVVNDLIRIREVCIASGVRVCVDCISSIGTMPVALRDVFLATCVSGKAIAAMPGLSMVFHSNAIAPSERLPRYLDLGYAAECDGVPFTQSSNLVAALRVATERTLGLAPFSELADLGTWLRGRLRALGFSLVAAEAHAAPAIVTIALPSGLAGALGDWLAAAGFELSYRSEYLRRKGWIQIALMGEVTRDRLTGLLDALTVARGEVLTPGKGAPSARLLS